MNVRLKKAASGTRSTKVSTNLIQQAPTGKTQNLNEIVSMCKLQAVPKT